VGAKDDMRLYSHLISNGGKKTNKGFCDKKNRKTQNENKKRKTRNSLVKVHEALAAIR